MGRCYGGWFRAHFAFCAMLPAIPHMPMQYLPLLPVLLPLVILILACIRQVNQYERGILFTMGKYSRMWQPGWHILIPIFQSLKKVDVRTKAVDVPDQEAITKDNIPVTINAVIYFRVSDAAKAIIEVEDFFYAVGQLAQTTMRNAVGEVQLNELLSNKQQVSEGIKLVVDKVSDAWGIDVQSVELKDIVLPESLKRTIAKVAEADRERQAVIISSEGEVMASKNMAQAAATLAATPGALHLRTLQSINDLSSDQSNTVVWMVPVEALKALEGLGELVKKVK
jgi:regulator of protease activity HflC (stomatin/prohibitin superfamily)